MTDWPAPSPRVVGVGAVETPESASVQVKLTVTATLFQPFEFGKGDLELDITGGVLSILIPDTVAEFELPALSVQSPVLDWPVPSDETICGLTGPAATPERESAQLKATVTSPLFHPLEFGEGEVDPVTTGRVLSIFKVTELEPVRPAPLAAVQVTVVPEVSEVKLVVPHPEDEAVPDSGSDTDQLTVTVTLFQPFAFGPGVTVGTITGPVVSTP